jgi:hypothetical protein
LIAIQKVVYTTACATKEQASALVRSRGRGWTVVSVVVNMVVIAAKKKK